MIGFFFDKKEWIETMGYVADNNFVEILSDKIKAAYCFGNYEIVNHTKYGVKINLFISLEGKNIKNGRKYNLNQVL